MERPKLDGETAERIINPLRNNPGVSMTLSDIADGTTLPVEDMAVYMEELTDHQHVVAEQTDDGFDTYRFPEHKQLGSVAPPNLLSGFCNVPAHTTYIPMIERAKENWQEFKDSEPGERFQDRYNRRQQEEHGRWSKGAILNVALGLLIIVGGLLIGLVPGPGGFIAIFGLGLIGSEFQPMAKALDWAELKVRAAASWAKNIWDVLPLGGKVIVGVLALVVVAAVAYGGYVLFFGGLS